MRASLDTNALVSAFVFPGDAPEHVYRRLLLGQITLITPQPLLSEPGRVLTGKFGWEPSYAQEVVAQRVRTALVVDPTEHVMGHRDDPADNRVLEAEAEGAADVIVSGDRHMRRLGPWRGIPTMDPTLFTHELG